MSCASAAAFKARSIPMLSTRSPDCLMPAVSVRLRTRPPMSRLSLIVSRVVPAISVTIALSSLRSAFKREDLPAFGLPAMTTLRPSFMIFPVSNEARRSFSSFNRLSTLGKRVSIKPSRLICSGSSSAASMCAVSRIMLSLMRLISSRRLPLSCFMELRLARSLPDPITSITASA